MKKSKMIVLVGLMALVVISSVFASGQAESAKREQITMWFWGAAPEYRIAIEEALIKPYNASQDKYELVITYDNAVDNNSHSWQQTQELLILYTERSRLVSQYAQAGKLLDLSPYAAKYGWSDRILDPIYKAGKVGDKLFSLPGGTITMGVFYNKKVLDALRAKDSTLSKAAPATLAELEAFMDAAHKNGYMPRLPA